MKEIRSKFPIQFWISPEILAKARDRYSHTLCVGGVALRAALGDTSNAISIRWNNRRGYADGIAITTKPEIPLMTIKKPCMVTFDLYEPLTNSSDATITRSRKRKRRVG
jgi:hypothetical protein